MDVFKKILFSFCILLSSIVLSDAQVFKAEIIGGINLTQVDGDQEIGYKKIGAHTGIGVMFPFNFKRNQENKPWAVSMEILFNQRGARARNLNYNPQDTIAKYSQGKFRYLLRLNYVSVPVIIHFTDKDKWTVGLGMAYNRMFSSKEWEYDVLQTHDSLRLNSNDFTVLADVRFRIWQQLKFGFRFEYSMFSLRTRKVFPYTTKTHWETRNQYNNNLTFYLVFMLNEKKVERTKKREKIEKPYYY